jgi:hypothetical protein
MTDREQLLLELEQAPESVIDQVRHLLRQIRQPEWHDDRPTIVDVPLGADTELPPAILELRRLRKLGKPFPDNFDPDEAKWAYLREKHNL